MLEARTIFQGDTPVWLVGHDTDGVGTLADLSAGYVCRIRVVGTAIDRAVSDLEVGNLHFLAGLTTAETAAIAPGNYIIAIQIEKAAAGFNNEVQGILTVKAQAIGGSVDPVLNVEVERLTAEIAEAKAQRHLVALGRAAVDVWRDGRRVRTPVQSLDELNGYIRTLEGELLEAQMEAGIAMTTTRRSAIGTYYG